MANKLTAAMLACCALLWPLAATAQSTRAASDWGLTPGGAVVATSGASLASGAVAFTAVSQSVVIDAAGAGAVNLGVQGTFTGTIKVQWSDSPTTGFQDGKVTNAAGTEVSTITAVQQYAGGTFARYLRLTTTAWTSGTATVTPLLRSQRFSPAGAGGGGGSFDGVLTTSTAKVGDVGTASFSATCTTLTLPGTGGTYASGDLVANSATAGSVTPLTCTVARFSGGPVTITRARIQTSTTGISNASFRVHGYTGAPTVTNGNDGVFLSSSAGHFCRLDVTVDQAFSDGAIGAGIPTVGTSCTRVLSATSDIRVLVEARAAYAWTAAQTLTLVLEGFN